MAIVDRSGTGKTGQNTNDKARLRILRRQGNSAAGGTGGGGAGAGPGDERRPGPPWLPVVASLALAAVLHLAWVFLIANSGGDLAAQDAWAEFALQHPGSAYSLAWFGGMHPVSYSAISPYLMAVLGVRTTMVIVGTLSAGLIALLLVRSRAVQRPLWPALYGALALSFNAISGRVTFGLGMMFGLAAVAVIFAWPVQRRPRQPIHRWARGGLAALLSGLATASSPVAGLYVGIVAAALWLTGRRPAACALGVTPVLVVALSSWFFPFSGKMPMAFGAVVLPLLSSVAVFVFAPEQWRTVRVSSLLYAVAVVLAWLIPSQIGSNITRLGMVFGGVVLLAVLPTRRLPRLALWHTLGRKWVTLAVTSVVVMIWPGIHSARDVDRTTPSASWSRELTPLLDQLERAGAGRSRVEVVPASSHRESSAIASRFNLARGWNRQADVQRNPLFYEGELTPVAYHAWLLRWAVGYVVLPSDKPDDAGQAEAQLVSRGQPFLDEVWSDGSWKLYKVQNARPMVGPSATVRSTSAEELVIEVHSAGPVLIRIPYSPWLGLIDKQGRTIGPPKKGDEESATVNVHGCLSKQVEEAHEGQPEDEWTVLHAPRPGTYRIGARYTFPRGTHCPDELAR
ncbi:DMT family transporter [Streptomyces sp. SRF1]|uniref:DMT family transporter n=1 Tax=Streptomyces sp. SRF1 TaxID=1549642 RepID=UPI0025B2729A|nr:DMT family transporter [Streptomyces sp. SRF1]MDN3058182.1 DMT family transporter [Streptomyces sp. SRF1]